MLGVGMLHMLPHAVVFTRSVEDVAWWALVGLLGMFYLLRVFHFHQHDLIETESNHEIDPSCSHHNHNYGHGKGGTPGSTDHPLGEKGRGIGGRLGWLGIMIGLSIHTIIDGTALAANVCLESSHSEDASSGWFPLWGLGTALAIFLHKPLDAMSISTVMKKDQWSKSSTNLVNILFASMCPLGILLFYGGIQFLGEEQSYVIGCCVALAGGVFLCIALSDILPEIHFHSHDRFLLSFCLLLGVAIAYGIGFLEPEHTHDIPAEGLDSLTNPGIDYLYIH